LGSSLLFSFGLIHDADERLLVGRIKVLELGHIRGGLVDGVAIDACTTYSIGFRAPTNQELAEAFVDHLRDTLSVPGRYADPDLRATAMPGRIGKGMQRRVAAAIAAIRWNGDDIGRFLGRYLSEPKPDVVFARGVRRSRADFARRIGRKGVRLDRRTQLLYDDARVYVNGEDRPMPASGANALRDLADRRALGPQACVDLAPEVIDMLHDWQRHGFLADA